MAKSKLAPQRPLLNKYRPLVELLEAREAPGNSTLGPTGFVNPALFGGTAALAIAGSPVSGRASTGAAADSGSSIYQGFNVGGGAQNGGASSPSSSSAPAGGSSTPSGSNFYVAPGGEGATGAGSTDASTSGNGFGSAGVGGTGGSGGASLNGGSVNTGGADPLNTVVMTNSTANTLSPANAPTAFTGEYIHTGHSDMFWAVTLRPGVDPGLFAASVGAVNHGSVKVMANTYILKFGEGANAGYINQGLARNSNVLWSEQQVRRQYTTNAVPNDEFFRFQWHLRNTAEFGGLPGADANVVPVWDEFQGRGVTIGIVDSGVEYTHEDMAPNYDFASSFDFTENDTDAWWRSDDDGKAHGTSVAGVAAGRGFNTVGISGAAPMSQIAGLKLIDGTGISDFQVAQSQSFANNVIDIYNNSWGKADPDVIVYQSPLHTATMEANANFARQGRGTIHVWSAGNSHLEGSSANYDATKSNQWAINVGALTESGTKSDYSEEGSNVFVSAYSNGGALGIVTTDIFDGYTAGFGGTSSAAPLVSGVIALMLEANPNLTWRDVKAILARSSRRTDPNDPSWTRNAAGLWHSNKYGFGAIDAKASVDLARTWVNLPTALNPFITDSMVVNQTIPTNVNGLNRSFNIPQNFVVEHVEVVFTAVHESLGQISLELTSPSGTRMTVPPLVANEEDDAFVNFPFGFVGFHGEQSQGTWSLRVRDVVTGDETGSMIRWQLRLYGHQPQGGVVPPPVGGGGASDGTHDVRYERNNSTKEASNLGSLIGPSIEVQNLAIASRTDKDYFKFTTTRAGNLTAEIAITGNPILHVKLYRYDARTRRYIELGRGQGTKLQPGGIQRVTWAVAANETIFVQVLGHNRAVGNYHLKISQV